VIGWLALRVVVAAFAFGVGVHLTRWRRRSRAQWREYDDQYGDPRPTQASLRAKLALRDRD
jgi:hypothetical protein